MGNFAYTKVGRVCICSELAIPHYQQRDSTLFQIFRFICLQCPPPSKNCFLHDHRIILIICALISNLFLTIPLQGLTFFTRNLMIRALNMLPKIIGKAHNFPHISARKKNGKSRIPIPSRNYPI